jgi:hypothetical protein
VTNGATIIGYVRVSTEEQGTDGAGLDAQKYAIEQDCARRGCTLVRIEQDVASGKSTNGRPGLHRALEAVRRGEAQGIVVAKLDRLTRSVVSFGQLLHEASSAGWNIVALDFGLDLYAAREARGQRARVCSRVGTGDDRTTHKGSSCGQKSSGREARARAAHPARARGEDSRHEGLGVVAEGDRTPIERTSCLRSRW